jgi:glyceraldehyde-3-phosphate dehydrogenase (NADP+)
MQHVQLAQKIQNIFPPESEIPEKFRLSAPINQTEYLINGELRHWNGPFKEVTSPVMINSSSGLCPAVLGSYPLLTSRESSEALDAAVKAYDNGRGVWPTMEIEKRIKHVEDFVCRMIAQKEIVTKLLAWEIAKSWQDAEKEFDRTIQYILDTIEALKNLDRSSSRFVIEQKIIGQIRRSPLGVVLCMGPYNYPLNETFATLIPALIMGNTVLFKPPSVGVLLHYPLLEAFRDSFPEGVINSIYGSGSKVISPLMENGKIDVLAFIGSSEVADALKKLHPKPHRLRCVLGLGAKNPAIILPDADLDLAVKECVLGALSYNGQRCTALKIVFVHSQIVPQFLAKISLAMNNLNIGMPWQDNVEITPLPESGKIAYLQGLVDDAITHGAKVVNEAGGTVNQTFFFPAVLYPVNSEMKVYSEEQFGPIIPILPFNDIENPINYLINSNYGQQVSIFGQNPDNIARLIDPLVNQVCRVNINSQCQRGPDSFPFNGRKDSAEGTLSVSDALRSFSIRTIVAAKDLESNKRIIKSIVKEHKSKFLASDFIF